MKHPFTPEGVAAWQLSLQPLTHQQRQELATQISADFKTWLVDTFILEESQINYLDGINAIFLNLTSAHVAFAVANKLNIKLSKPGAPALRGTKLIRDKSKVEGDADGEGNVSADGEVAFEILYD